MNDRTACREIPYGWPEMLPRVTVMLLSRTSAGEDNDDLVEQLHNVGRLLAEERFADIADYFTDGEMDEVRTVALLLAVGMAADEPIDVLFAALTPEERFAALEHVDAIEESLSAEMSRSVTPTRYLMSVPTSKAELRVEPVSQALAAGTMTRTGQLPGIHRFRVIVRADTAEVAVRLGGGPLHIRQVSGPRLGLGDPSRQLPGRDWLAVEVDDGTDLTR